MAHADCLFKVVGFRILAVKIGLTLILTGLTVHVVDYDEYFKLTVDL